MPPTIPNTNYDAVDAYTFAHSHPSTRPSHPILATVSSAAKAAGLSNIALSSVNAKFLALFCRAANITHVLELGTLGGFTAIFLAGENPQLRLTTVEMDPHAVEVARKNVADAGLQDRIDVVEGAALTVLEKLKEEVLGGKRPKFGLVFIDADKENNWNYFDTVVGGMVVPRGVVVVDNVVQRGNVLQEGNVTPRVKGAREVIEKAGKDARVDSVVVQSVGEKGHDGWLWAVVN